MEDMTKLPSSVHSHTRAASSAVPPTPPATAQAKILQQVLCKLPTTPATQKLLQEQLTPVHTECTNYRVQIDRIQPNPKHPQVTEADLQSDFSRRKRVTVQRQGSCCCWPLRGGARASGTAAGFLPTHLTCGLELARQDLTEPAKPDTAHRG